MPWSRPDIIVAVFMAVGVLAGVAVGVIFVFRRIGNQKSNLFFAALLFAFGLSLLNIIFIGKGMQEYYPKLQLLPLRFTLALGPCFFYFVKFSLFPSYELRRTDFKHFLLPLWQLSFYLIVGFRSVEFKSQFGEAFMQPFYRDFEQVLFLITFWTYLFLAYRYIRYRLALLRRQNYPWQIQKMMWLRRVVRITVLLIAGYSFYFLSDFVGYHFFRLNFHNTSWFTYTGDLFFTGIVLWLSYAGFRIAFLDYQLSKTSKTKLPPAVQVKLHIEKEQAFLDPEFRPSHLKYRFGLSPKVRQAALQKAFGQSFWNIVTDLRITQAKQRLLHARFQQHNALNIGLEVGFPSKKAFAQAFKASTGLSPKAFRQSALSAG